MNLVLGTACTVRPTIHSLKSFFSQQAAYKIRPFQSRYRTCRIVDLSSIARRSFATEVTEDASRVENKQELLPSTTVELNQEEITLFPDNWLHPLNLSLIWLRDHCRCSQCVNKDTNQRSFDTFSVPYGVGTRYAIIGDQLKVDWPDDHISVYSLKQLRHLSHSNLDLEPTMKREYWGSEIKNDPPLVHYDVIMRSDAAVGTWTSKIAKYGFCFVDGCPKSPEKTKKLLERIAFIRVTHYGGFYDFTSDLTMKDTAYTSLALPAHTDNTYFTDPSGLQMFHILSHTDGDGGASLLVDGFHCANLLKQAHPQAYKILANYPVQWHASGNDGIVITPARRFPVLNELNGTSRSKLRQIRWNNDDRAAMPLHSYMGTAPKEWYEAARLWNSIVKDEQNEYWEQLKPGRPLIFDNWRVMHGRSAFTGKRRICGGYINRDDYMSRYYNTNMSREDILKQIL